MNQDAASGLNPARNVRIIARAMIKVKLRPNESVEQMIRRFRKTCEKEGLIRDIKRHTHYEKPSETRRRKERQAVRKIMREARRQKGLL
jgi:small subunit ribosomal protein S21